MSNELISALENRVITAVDTIEGLRTEIHVLREERQLLESKLRELLQKIEAVDNKSAATASNSPAEPGRFSSHGSVQSGAGTDDSSSDY